MSGFRYVGGAPVIAGYDRVLKFLQTVVPDSFVRDGNEYTITSGGNTLGVIESGNDRTFFWNGNVVNLSHVESLRKKERQALCGAFRLYLIRHAARMSTLGVGLSQQKS